MDLANGKHDYTLTRPIDVHFKGVGDKEVIMLTLYEPTRQHVKQSAKLRQMVMISMIELSEKNNAQGQAGQESKQIHDKTDEEHEKDSAELYEAMKIAILMSEKLDLGDFVEFFIDMALKPTKKPLIKCDDEIPIKDIHFDQMSADEVTDLAIAYASFFYMPSVMQGNE